MNSLIDLRGSTAIVGVGTAGCGEAPDFSDMEVLARAAHAAVADSGLTWDDIDWDEDDDDLDDDEDDDDK